MDREAHRVLEGKGDFHFAKSVGLAAGRGRGDLPVYRWPNFGAGIEIRHAVVRFGDLLRSLESLYLQGGPGEVRFIPIFHHRWGFAEPFQAFDKLFHQQARPKLRGKLRG